MCSSASGPAGGFTCRSGSGACIFVTSWIAISSSCVVRLRSRGLDAAQPARRGRVLIERNAAALEWRRENDRRFRANHAGNRFGAGKKLVEVLGVPRDDFEHVRLLAGDAVNFAHFRKLRNVIGKL